VTVAGTDDEGSIYLIVVNRDTSEPATATIDVRGRRATGQLTAWSVNGPHHLAFNTIARPDKVTIRTKEFGAVSGEWSYEFPAHSVTALKLTP
jgi:alpha-N-arabinofuranosidase